MEAEVPLLEVQSRWGLSAEKERAVEGTATTENLALAREASLTGSLARERRRYRMRPIELSPE
jgi:hypothetical protein